MNDATIASKTKAQLANFMGKVFTHFSKPSKKFVEECIYGIQASGDTKLSSIVRPIDDYISPICTEKRLNRNLDDETLEPSVAEAVLKDGQSLSFSFLFLSCLFGKSITLHHPPPKRRAFFLNKENRLLLEPCHQHRNLVP